MSATATPVAETLTTTQQTAERQVAVQHTATKPTRILSIDILRGITIAFMILVNDPGDGRHAFAQLDHAAWNGWTLTDVVFPTFLFLVGASTIFSLEARERRGDCRKTLTGYIFWRATKLFLLKTTLSLVPYFHWQTMRIYGVLTRIALCYLLAGLILLTTRKAKALIAIVAALLIGYWILLRFVPVPGNGLPIRDFPLLDKYANLTAWMDRGISLRTLRWLHTGTLYEKTRDPEGFLSTLPSIATTLIGAIIALWLRRPEWTQGQTLRNNMRNAMLAFGGAMFIAGSLWGRWFPVNKNLWTSSYVLVMAGIATLLLALLNFLVDARPQPWPRWLRLSTWPWLVFGANAIAAYTTSVILVKLLLDLHHTGADGKSRTLWNLAYLHGFSHGNSTPWTSLAFALTFVALSFLPNWWLWRKKLFWKI